MKTNREKYIDNASNEELAKWLTYRHIYNPLTNRIVCYDAIKENSLEVNNMKYWLSQEAEEDKREEEIISRQVEEQSECQECIQCVKDKEITELQFRYRQQKVRKHIIIYINNMN